jgi:hypothetical protein
MLAQTSVGLPASSPGSLFRLGALVQPRYAEYLNVYNEREGQP